MRDAGTQKDTKTDDERYSHEQRQIQRETTTDIVTSRDRYKERR